MSKLDWDPEFRRAIADDEPYIDLITGKPVDQWVADDLEQRQIDRVVKRVAEAFRQELIAILRGEKPASRSTRLIGNSE